MFEEAGKVISAQLIVDHEHVLVIHVLGLRSAVWHGEQTATVQSTLEVYVTGFSGTCVASVPRMVLPMSK